MPIEPKLMEEDDELSKSVKRIRQEVPDSDLKSMAENDLKTRGILEQDSELSKAEWKGAKSSLSDLNSLLRRRDLAQEEKMEALRLATNPEKVSIPQAAGLALLPILTTAIGAGLGGVEGGAAGARAGAQGTATVTGLLSAEADRRQKGYLSRANMAQQEIEGIDSSVNRINQEQIRREGMARDEAKDLRNFEQRERHFAITDERQRELNAANNAARKEAAAISAGIRSTKTEKSEERAQHKEERADAKEERSRLDKLTNSLYNASSRRTVGMAKQQTFLIDKLEGLLEVAGTKSSGKKIERRDLANMSYDQLVKSFDNLDKQDVGEVILALNDVLSRGVGSDSKFEHLMPQSWTIWKNEMQQRMTNTPTGSQAGKFVARVYKTLLNERQKMMDQLGSEASGLISPVVYMVEKPEYLDFFRRAVNDHDIDPADFGERYVPYLIGSPGDPFPLTEEQADALPVDDLKKFVNGNGVIIFKDGSWEQLKTGRKSK